MNITVNGEPRDAEPDVTLEALLGSPQGIAAALNGVVVSASAWRSTRLSDGDAVDVVTAHQGG